MIPGLGESRGVRQTDLLPLQRSNRLVGPPVVARVPRIQLGGGFGDQERHPNAWGVFVQVDGMMTRLISARGLVREWSSLDRLERWLREQGFRTWWIQNEVDVIGEPSEDAAYPGDG